MAEGRPHNDNVFSFLRRFEIDLEQFKLPSRNSLSYSQPCISLACLIFELTTQDLAGGILTRPLHVLNGKGTKVGQLFSLETALNH